ncbi:MAG: hypothetical protein WD534_16165 [Phycisphaeraceae bacterium]
MLERLTILVAVFALAPAARAEPEVTGPVPADQLMGPWPVDQGVSDLDPLSRSLRRVEPGNALHSPRVRITQMRESGQATGLPSSDPATGLNLPDGYRYSAPGVQALFDRPDYLVRTGPGRNDIGRNVAPAIDGEIMERVPAGTVYDLRPQATLQHLTPSLKTDAPADWQDTRIDGRYRIDGQLGPASPGQAIDRQRYPHIPPDTDIPDRLPRRFEPDEPDEPATEQPTPPR